VVATEAHVSGRGLIITVCGIWVCVAGVCAAVWRGSTQTGIVIAIVAGVLGTVAAAAGWFHARRAEQRLAGDIHRGTPNLAATTASPSAEPESIREALEALQELDRRLSPELEALRNERLAAAALVEALDEPLIVTDPDGRVLMVNAAAERLLQVPQGRADGRALTDVVTQADLLDLHTAARAGATGRAQVRIAQPGEDRLYQVMAAPLVLHPSAAGRSEPGVVLALRDITELAGAGQVKSDFVANASHELRTPIAAIRAAVETLTDAAGGAPVDAAMSIRLIRMIAEHSVRLEQLAGDLLALSRLEAPEAAVELECVPVAELVQALGAMFEQPCRQRNLKLVFETESLAPGAAGGGGVSQGGGREAPVLRTDRRLLMLILENLIDNATKFAYPDTAIRVAFRAVQSPGREGQLASRSPVDSGVRIEVIDTGLGIPAGQQNRVFERFYQVDAARTGSPRRGTGLGLAIVKHAVKRLGGSVMARSVWKQGTTMVVELPASLAAADHADSFGPNGTFVAATTQEHEEH
jgi:two-component system phosphate regulon sensor histidine kinase PhoR